jgi:hypothetical protein
MSQRDEHDVPALTSPIHKLVQGIIRPVSNNRFPTIVITVSQVAVPLWFGNLRTSRCAFHSTAFNWDMYLMKSAFMNAAAGESKIAEYP